MKNQHIRYVVSKYGSEAGNERGEIVLEFCMKNKL